MTFKKILSATLILSALLFPVLALGQGISVTNPLDYDDWAELADHIISFFFTVGLPLVTLMVLAGAFLLVVGGGDPKQVKKGRNFILYAAIGLAVLLFARGLLSLLKYILGAP